MKISASLIVKNESSCLDTCLSSIKGVDEIIVVDTGSQDNTVEIAKKYTDKVFEDYKWNDDFAEARNHSLSKCTGDWVLIIDADETLEVSIESIRDYINKAESKGYEVIDVICKSKKGKQTHNSPRLFKRVPTTKWQGKIHNSVYYTGNKVSSNLIIEYGYSEAHKLDPDRALRILKKVVEEDPTMAREQYYLAREYWYRNDYETALKWYKSYVKISNFVAEKADAYLMMARIYWITQRGNEAREMCGKAIILNPMFKEALLLMSEMHYSPRKEQWKMLASVADNSNVLFVRN